LGLTSVIFCCSDQEYIGVTVIGVVLNIVADDMFPFSEGLDFCSKVNIGCTKAYSTVWMQGLRAFLPLKEFINRPKTLEDYVSGTGS
jgi:hypothetical protein